MRTPWLPLATLALALAAPVALGVPSAADGPVPTLEQRTQRKVVSWEGTARHRVHTKTLVVPGIGNLAVVCRPDATLVRLHVYDRAAETQLWMAKHETKQGHAVVAVKTARIFRYATAADDGTGGTGRYAAEGFNQRTPIEDFASGHLDGVISQRPGRHRPAAGAPMKPVTSFRLTWWWTGFEHPWDWRSCRMEAVLRTRLDHRLGVSWHGNDDGTAGPVQTTTVPGLGQLEVRCEPDPDGAGSEDADQTISLRTATADARVWIEEVQGEGRVEHQVETWDLDRDPETGTVGPVPLPRNGMLRLFFTVDGSERAYVVSSYHVTNNVRRPELNLCEVAVAEL